MTARDDAIKAMADVFGDTADGIYEAIESTLSAAGYEPLFELLIDAVPPRVLAQLAIDTGALERLGYISVKRREFIPDTDKGYRGPVYRLVDEDGGPGGS